MDVLNVVWIVLGIFAVMLFGAFRLAARADRHRADDERATLSQQRVMVNRWQASIRQDVHRESMRRASQLKAVK